MTKPIFFSFLICALCFVLFVRPGKAQPKQHNTYRLDTATEFSSASAETYFYRIPDDSIDKYNRSGFSPDLQWMKIAAYRFALNTGSAGYSVKLDSFVKTMAPGYYVGVWVNEGKAYTRIFHNAAFKYEIRNVGRLKLLEVFDLSDKVLKDLKITRNGKELYYNSLHNAYVINPTDSGKTVIVLRGRGDEQRFTITRNTKPKERHVSRSRQEVIANYRNVDYTGYLVTNKPKYLPGDTIKFKAWLEMPDKRLVSEPVRVTLTENYGRDKTIFTNLRCKEPGLYFSEFIIGDSIKVGQHFVLTITGVHSGNFIRQQLDIEDYLLDETKLKVKLEVQPKFQKGDSVHIYCSAVNANNLAVLDGSINYTIGYRYLRSETISKKIRGKMISEKRSTEVQDTFVHATVPVNGSGETDLSFLIDGYIGEISSVYCRVSLVNSNFEKHDTLFYIPVTKEDAYIHPQLKGNTFRAELIRNKKSIADKGIYSIQNNNGWSAWKVMNFPFERKLNERDQSIVIRRDTLSSRNTGQFSTTFEIPALEVTDNYNKDTAYLKIRNSGNAAVSYTFYEGNIYKGFGFFDKDTLLKFQSKTGNTITVYTSYRTRNRVQENVYKIYKFDKDMQVDVVKKEFVFPGQKDSISVRLTDNNGVAVPRTNLTVLAFNSNFREDYVPDLESDKMLKPSYTEPYYEQMDWFGMNNNLSAQAVTDQWLKKCAADTLFFYRKLFFLKGGFASISFPTPDAVMSQIAFYIKEGNEYVLPEIIYMDNNPVYFFNAISVNPKGFFLENGTHNFTLRTRAAQYIVNNINIDSNRKFVYFINSDPKSFAYGNYRDKFWASRFSFYEESLGLSKSETPATLTSNDIDYLARYFFIYKTTYNNPPVHIIQYPYYFSSAVQGRYNSGFNIFGPLNPSKPVSFWQSRLNKTELNMEANKLISIEPGKIRYDNLQLSSVLVNPGLGRNVQWPQMAYVHPNPESWESLYEQTKNSNLGSDLKDKDEDYTLQLRVPDTIKGKRAQFKVESELAFRYFMLYNTANASLTHIFKGQTYTNLSALPSVYNFIAIDYQGRAYRLADFNIQLRKANIIRIKTDAPSESFAFDAPPSWLLPYIGRNNSLVHYKNVGDPHLIYGKISDEKNEAFAGATIKVFLNGNLMAETITDYNGAFSIKNLKAGKYEVQFWAAAYATKIIKDVYLNRGLAAEIVYQLVADKNEPGEVIVKAGKAMPNATTAFEVRNIERMPSQNIVDLASSSPNVQQYRTGAAMSIGGARSDATRYVMDGTISTKGTQMVKSKEIDESGTDISDDEQEESTNRKSKSFINDFINNQMAASGIRKNFRDWAIWEPALWTDKQGNTSFKVTYPDNMTSWKTYFLAMNNKGYAVKVMNITKAFKPLSAELSAPRFLRYGDSVELVGKVSNYTEKPYVLSTVFSKDGKLLNSDSFSINNIKVAKQWIAVPNPRTPDSSKTTLSYTMKTRDGYEDGEERTIPVFPVGAEQYSGQVFDLKNDSVMFSAPDPSKGFVGKNAKISVDAGLIDIMLREIENLQLDPHGCVEQMTTKLVSINFQEAIKAMMNDTSASNVETKMQLKKKLIAAQNPNGSFGWWSGNAGNVRVTNYVVNALYKDVSDVGMSGIVKNALEFFHRNLDSMNDEDRIMCLHTMARANYTLDYPFFIKRFDSAKLNNYNRLVVADIKRIRNINNRKDLDTVMKNAIKENNRVHWRGTNYNWYADDLATTLLAYSLVKKDSVYGSWSDKVMNYILYERRSGYYGNTAASGLVLQTILPDLLVQNKITDPKKYVTKVCVGGSVIDTITNFPSSQTVTSDKLSFSLQKTGISPAYVSVMYHYFNPDPEPYDSVFSINTYFIGGGNDTVQQLKQGEKVMLRANVRSKKNTDYVMIEMPIPAGCVPVLEKTPYRYNEAYREVFKDRIFIFCNSLSAGVYDFDIQLEPRYRGSFNMNPARASMMYYPEEFGNSKMKRVEIR